MHVRDDASKPKILIHKIKIISFLDETLPTYRTWKGERIFNTHLCKATLEILIVIQLTTVLLTQ